MADRSNQSNYRWSNIKDTMRNRFARRVDQNLGIIKKDSNSIQKYRDSKLEKYDSYYENRQYNLLPDWDSASAQKGDYVAVRKRKPKINYPFAKMLSQRLVAKFIGQSVFPSFKIEDSPIDQEFIKAVLRDCKVKTSIIEPMRRTLNTGSYFLRFYLENGAIKYESYDSKYCYPTFQSNGELESITIQYLYQDMEDKDIRGNYKWKWFRMDLSIDQEILFDNPEYVENEEPIFNIVNQISNEFGFVQGQWFRTYEDSKSPDGYGLVCDIMEFIDEICYSMSQSSQSVSYNQDPILTFNNMNEDEQDSLIRSVMKAWNLGRDGSAQFLESNLSGVQRASELRDKVTQNIGEITRVVMLDPEKIVGSAQSAKAMEILHAPLKDLIDELRASMENQFKSLVLKLSLLILMANKMGIPVPIVIPDGYEPQNLNFEIVWPPIFQQTMEDLQKKVQVASSATAANIISRDSATRWLAKDFDIEDIELELQKIANQPIINPFGGF